MKAEFSAAGLPTGALPSPLVRYLEAQAKRELRELERVLGPFSALLELTERAATLEVRLREIDASKTTEIAQGIRSLVARTFGQLIADQFVRFEIGAGAPRDVIQEAPLGMEATVSTPAARGLSFFRRNRGAIQSISGRAPGPNQGLSPLEITRREIYNMLAAAWGWRGSMALIDSADSVFPDPYRAAVLRPILSPLHDLRRFLDVHVKSTLVEARLGRNADSSSTGAEIAGRQCCRVTGQRELSALGESYLTLGERSAYAVGWNSWVLAHEAFKAGFQLRTAHESVARLSMSQAERAELTRLVDGPDNERRQFLFGPAMELRWSSRIRQVFQSAHPDRAFSLEDYFEITDRVFSATDTVFDWVLNDLVAPASDPSAAALHRMAARFVEEELFR